MLGLYRSMLRTYEAWKDRAETGELEYKYLGKQTPEHIGRECHVIKRVCKRVEIDAFEVGGKASTDPNVVAAEGFTEVTIYIDAERWLQVGTELYRTEPDGTRVLVGAYYFRDVQLNPSFAPNTFTEAGLKK
jgi:outer membrane lipoprotein-sorting protein